MKKVKILTLVLLAIGLVACNGPGGGTTKTQSEPRTRDGYTYIDKEITIDEKITSLDIDIDLDTIDIVQGEEAATTISYSQVLDSNEEVIFDIHSSYEENALTISDVHKSKDNRLEEIADRIFRNIEANKQKTTITLGTRAKLEDLSIGMDMAQARIQDIESDNVAIRLDMGQATLTNTLADQASIQVGMGELNWQGQISDVDCQVEMGKLTLKLDEAKTSNFTGQVDAGNLELTADLEGPVSVSVDMGSATIKNKAQRGSYLISQKQNMGNITLAGPEEDARGKYPMDLQVDMGNIDIEFGY